MAGDPENKSFNDEFLTALQAGKDERTLFEIVRQHFGKDDRGRDAYQSLEELWRDLGFPNSDESSPLQNQLEYVMERVWYHGADAGCPVNRT
jgi:hypothetical protein